MSTIGDVMSAIAENNGMSIPATEWAKLDYKSYNLPIWIGDKRARVYFDEKGMHVEEIPEDMLEFYEEDFFDGIDDYDQ